MIFVDKNSAIDKESLRRHAVEILNECRESIYQSLTSSAWNKLHDFIGLEKSDKKRVLLRASESQALGLPYFISSYLKTALDSKERLELFVQLKAAELESSDEQHNYFWALQIRHDQIVSLMRIVQNLTEKISVWSKLDSETIISDPEFIKLSELSIEEQIYLEAENVYKERSKVLK